MFLILNIFFYVDFDIPLLTIVVNDYKMGLRDKK